MKKKKLFNYFIKIEKERVQYTDHCPSNMNQYSTYIY